MPCEVLFTDAFEAWWNGLNEDEQISVAAYVELLAKEGVALRFPYSSRITTAVCAMRELRVQHGGDPYRVLYAFDPVRQALLLLGGNKTGDGRWYEVHVPRADKIFADYLKETEAKEIAAKAKSANYEPKRKKGRERHEST